ncbi:MAG: class I SAM-dependent RNA methyltransferase [Oscillospiraceae bacterium]|nr:class I SAM-dependent RNA methyltransferase [Oscillospiraceae bacterium]
MSTHIVTVTGYGSGGEGIARLEDGRVVFIRQAAREDVLEVRITREHARSARAEIVRVLSPSPYRTEQHCPVYPECGGCDFRHILYEEELRAKLRRVNDALRRIGGLSARAEEILSAGPTGGYRNKAVFHSDGTALGFYRAQSHDIVPVKHCQLCKPEINDALQRLQRSSPPAGETELRSSREEELDGLVFQVSGFFQVNAGAARLLYQTARQYAALTRNDTLLDLYCGVGALTLFAGRDAGRALGVEIHPASVEAARENARRNRLPHIEFLCADAADRETALPAPDCVIADPPRRGLSPGAVRKILGLSPPKIVYLSCDPATLARDVRSLEGYGVKDIRAVDMFPRTANVECCCLLVRGG